MRLITVTAIVPQDYDGRPIAAGEVFTVSPIEAAALAYRGRAWLGERAPRVQPAPPKRTRRAYKRRDLTAEE